MRRLKSLLFVPLLFACADDDNTYFKQNDIINKWYITATTFSQDTANYSETYVPCQTDYIEFTSDKFRTVIVTDCNESIYNETEYTISGNKIIKGSAGSEIIELSKNKMKIREQVRYFVTPEHTVIETVIITYKPVPLQ